jgi:DNA-binding transcriptional ArsR family regulator
MLHFNDSMIVEIGNDRRMDDRRALLAFGALAQETRLAIVRRLVKAGPAGVPAGVLAGGAGVSASNVSFHLKELERAGLVSARREARSIIYAADYAALGALIRFLTRDCCGGRPEICAPAFDPGRPPARKPRTLARA